MSEIKEELQKTLEDFRERILELNKSERVIDNIKADELKECAITLEKILKGENYKKGDYAVPEKILGFTDMVVEKLQEIYDPASQSPIDFWDEARSVLDGFSMEDILKSLIEETGIIEVVEGFDAIVSEQGQNVELWDNGYREYPLD